ncbi:MAG: B12-binding domain-containing radical SAM protein [Candidatus Odinarchaeota archaeon]
MPTLNSKTNNGKIRDDSRIIILMQMPSPANRYPFGLARLTASLTRYNINVKRLYPLELNKVCKKLDIGSNRYSINYINGKQPLPFVSAIVREFEEKGEITAKFLEEGVFVDICESMAISPLKFREEIASAAKEIESWIIDNMTDSGSAAVVGFTLYESNILTTVITSLFIRKHWPRTRIVYGGPTVTQDADRKLFLLLKTCDYCVRAEGEIAFPELCKKLILEYPGETPVFENISTIPNISAIDISGEIKESKVMTIKNLDDLPRPDLSDIRFWQRKLLKYSGSRKNGLISAPVEGSRGCPMGCYFCSEWNMHGKFRIRSVSKVVDEIEYYRKHGIWSFHFVDSLIDHNKEWLLSFARELLKRDLHIAWGGYMTASPCPRSFTSEEIKELKKSGLVNVTIGIEALEDKILESLGKGKRLRENRFITIDRLVKEGIIVNVNLIVIPSQKFKDIEKFLLEIKKLQEKGLTIQCNSIRVLEYRQNSRMLKKLLNEKSKKLLQIREVFKKIWGKLIGTGVSKKQITTWGETFPELRHFEPASHVLQIPAAVTDSKQLIRMLKWSELLYEDILALTRFPSISMLVDIVKRIFPREELEQKILAFTGDSCFHSNQRGLIEPEIDIFVQLGVMEGELEPREISFLRDLAKGYALSRLIELQEQDFSGKEDELFDGLIYPLIAVGIVVVPD